jgi:signal transduction histidine kinase
MITEQEMGTAPLRHRVGKRVLAYALTGVGLLLAFFLVKTSNWQGNKELHTIMEVIATLLAVTIGVLALIRYIAKRDNTILFIGAAFLGTALLDGYHTVVTSHWFEHLWPSPPPHLLPWSWNASRTFLALAMVLSWRAWHRERKLGDAGAIRPGLVFSLVAALPFGAFTIFALLPLPRAYYPEFLIQRPGELLSALFFGLALAGYLKKGAWKEDLLEHWLVLSLIVGFLCQSVFIVNSAQLFDGMFDAAHLLKMVGYHCVLTGLIFSLTRVQVQAEMDRGAVVTAEKLEQITEDLRKRNTELDEFTYVASHDLQEPLRKLSSFVSLLEKDIGDDISEQAKQDMFYIDDAASRMQKLVRDLLALSRAGRTAMQRERIPVAVCIDQALDSLMIRVEELSAKITRDPLPRIHGDQTMITQLYQNLIGNALKFIPEGQTPEIRLTAEKLDDEIVLGVKDNGIGISQEYIAQVFVAFKRLHGRTEYEGSGIGLAICRKTVERHGGRLWCDSEPGIGSHFRFTLENTELLPDDELGSPPMRESEQRAKELVEV